VRSDPVYVVKARMFRTLGHPVRIRILELLRDGERSVGELQVELNLDSSGTSQHLSALRQLGLLDGRRVGTSVFYSIADPRVTELLATAKQILTSALTVSHSLLDGLADGPHEDATHH
jgi:ArsR family transcriptional regulator